MTESLDKSASLGNAVEIMGTDFVSCEQVADTYGVDVPPFYSDLGRPIPFTPRQLLGFRERAQHFLRLRIAGLSMEEIETKVQPRWDQRDKGKLLARIHLPGNFYYRDSDFFTKEQTSSGWVLAAKEVLPRSVNLNIFEQIVLLARHIREVVFENQEELPAIWAQALAEFEDKKGAIETALSDLEWNDQVACRKVVALQLFQLSARSPVEIFDDGVLWRDHTEKTVALSMRESTRKRGAPECLICMPFSASSRGISVSARYPSDRFGDLGISFSPQSLV